MPANSKILMLSACGVVVLGAGGYVGAQAVVGNEVEKALLQSFAELDSRMYFYVTDLNIEKSLFQTTATATIGIEGIENADAHVDLLVDHGVINSPITGTIHLNEQLLVGDIEVDLVASRRSVKGQLTASSLSAVELDGSLRDLVVDINLEDKDVWHVDSTARDITINYEDSSIQIIWPRLENQLHKTSSLVRQRLEIPRVKFLSDSLSIDMDGIELEVESETAEDSQLVNSGGHFKIASTSDDGHSSVALSLNMDLKNWNLLAYQALQQAYGSVADMHFIYEEYGMRVDEQQERELLSQSIEHVYDVLIASPSVSFQPLEAHIRLTELNLDFKPRVTADFSFDGSDLSKEAIYSALWDRELPLPEQLTGQNAISLEDALVYIGNRMRMDINLTTPPPVMVSLFPPVYTMLIDPKLKNQHITWEEGILTVNGEQVHEPDNW